MYALADCLPLDPDVLTPPPRDHVFLRAAFAMAAIARGRGEGPFGAVLVNALGEVVGSGQGAERLRGDFTGHAEINLLRRMARYHTFKQFSRTTIYTSIEPCIMCAGAIWMCGIGRVVFGMERARLAKLLSVLPPDLPFNCREFLARTSRPISIDGPILEEEIEHAVLRNESSLGPNR